MKKIIWSLFDSETAITQKLNSDKYQVYSIGLPSSSALTDNFIHIDLSKKSCIKKLSKLPKPDIIFASPPCESWVNLNIGNVKFFDRNYNEHNLYWQKNFKPNNYMRKHFESRMLGQITAYWTWKIIQEFKPELWCIENGFTSLIFKYLHKFHGANGYKNMLCYNAYDSNFSQKRTVFFSNKKMLLKKTSISKDSNIRISINKSMRDKVIKSGEWIGHKSPTAYLKAIYREKETYCERSEVPIEVYQHILEIYEGKHQLVLEL